VIDEVPSSDAGVLAAQLNRQAILMRMATGSCLFALTLLAACAAIPEGSGQNCDSAGPESLKPATLGLIRVGMTRAQVENILGKPDHSPVEGQDYYSTSGECELEQGIMGPCVLVIEYRAYPDPTSRRTRLTGRVTGCFWGGVGE
jgi:hypothetical protein